MNTDIHSKPFKLFGSQWRYNWRDGVSIVYSTVCSGVDQRKYLTFTTLAFVRGIHRWPVDSPHKGPVTRKMFPFDDVIILKRQLPMVTCFILRLTDVIWLHRTWLSLVHVNNRRLIGAKPLLELIMGNYELYPVSELQRESNYKIFLP